MFRRIKMLFLGAVLLAAPMLMPVAAFALSGQIDGTIYWDQNNNGQQSASEPGVPGVVVTYGWGSAQLSAVTDSSGHYAITGATGSARLSVDSGWFRSACNSVNCSAGIAGGNDFSVATQYITIPSVNGGSGATLNTGLVPGWSGTYPIPAAPTSAAVDIAARISYNSGCSADSYRLCPGSAAGKLYINLFNQGTSDLSNPKFVIELPAGHTVDDGSWADPKDVYNVAHPDANTVTTLEGFSATKGYGVYKLNGTIPAGATSSMSFLMDVSNAATSSPAPYASGDPYDKQAQIRVIGMDQTGDPDTTLCEADGSDWRTGSCAMSQLGVHDKTKSLDASDGVGWNDNTSTAVATASYDPSATLGLASGQSGTANAGDLVRFNVNVANNGTGNAGTRNIKITDTVPSGMTFSAGDNPGWELVSGVPTTYVTVQVAPGDSLSVPIALRLDSGVTTADNGTPVLSNQAQIVSFQKNWASAAGVFATGTDSSTSNNSGTQAMLIGEVDEDDGGDEPGDVTSPSTPTDPTATTVSTTQNDLSWTASTDDVAVVGYHVFRNGTDIATVTGTTYSDAGLSPSTTYHYTVKAVDAAGNYSSASPEADATTWTPTGDTTPPSTPTGLTATAASTNSTNLSWTASTDDVAVTGYHVFRGSSDVATVTDTTYSDTGLIQGTTYHYTVKAVDAAGNYSSASATDDATTWSQFVVNMGAETNLTGWTDLWTPGTTTQTRTNTDAHSGSYAIRIGTTNTANTSAGFTNYSSANRWVTNTSASKTYTASVWVKTSMTGMAICMRQTEYTSTGANAGNTQSCTTSTSTTAWFQVTNTKTALANGNSITTSVYCSSMKSDRSFLTDDFSITAP